MNNLKIKSFIYMLIFFGSVISVSYIYISYKEIKQSTLETLNTKSINNAYLVSKQLSALNDKMAYQYEANNNNMRNALALAQDYLLKNGKDASLEELQKKIQVSGNEATYHIYLINNKYIINKTTLKSDLNLDFHVIPVALKILQKVYNTPNFIHISHVMQDNVTQDYKKYIAQRAHNEDYIIQISLTLNNENTIKNFVNNMSNKVPNLLSNKIYLIYMQDVKNIYIDSHWSKKSIHGSKAKRLLERNVYDEFVLMLKSDKDQDNKNFTQQLKNFEKDLKYKDKYYHKDGKYIHQILMPFYSYLNADEETIYIISIEFDETKAEEKIQNLNTIATFVWILLIILTLLGIWIVKSRIIRPIEILQTQMKKKEAINTKKLLNQHDEINSISLIYNQLLKDLKREIISNEELLDEFKNFTGNTIHQIRTPISVIKIALEMIETTNKEAVLQIQASLISVEHMYDSLSYALHHDGVDFIKEPLNLSKILEERIKLFSTIAKAYDKNIVYEIKPDITVNINKTELEYLIDNNLSNAIKYGEDTKEIFIRLNSISREITLSFDTYGKEIKDTKIIFQRFHRDDNSKKGHGIGLHMVDKICSNNNIFIKVSSYNNKNKFIYFFENII